METPRAFAISMEEKRRCLDSLTPVFAGMLAKYTSRLSSDPVPFLLECFVYCLLERLERRINEEGAPPPAEGDDALVAAPSQADTELWRKLQAEQSAKRDAPEAPAVALPLAAFSSGAGGADASPARFGGEVASPPREEAKGVMNLLRLESAVVDALPTEFLSPQADSALADLTDEAAGNLVARATSNLSIRLGAALSDARKAAKQRSSSTCSQADENGHGEEQPGAPPAEMCGYWFQNALSIELRLGTVEARRAKDLSAAPEGAFAWAIVSADGSMEWSAGEVQGGRSVVAQHVQGSVESWKSDCWLASGQEPLQVSSKEYTDVQGRSVLTSITVNGIRLQLTSRCTGQGGVVHVLLSEAQGLGWDRPILGALREQQALEEAALRQRAVTR